jgi:hypothetical protein
LKKEFPLTDEWVAYELRPEMPLEGMPMSTLFPGVDLKKRYESLSYAGSPYGISFNEISRASTPSRIVQVNMLVIRGISIFHGWHRAYLKRDIGTRGNLGVTSEDGLDDDSAGPEEKQHAAPRSQDKRADTHHRFPTFIINGKHKLVGAQPIEAFRDKFRIIQAE